MADLFEYYAKNEGCMNTTSLIKQAEGDPQSSKKTKIGVKDECS